MAHVLVVELRESERLVPAGRVFDVRVVKVFQQMVLDAGALTVTGVVTSEVVAPFHLLLSLP